MRSGYIRDTLTSMDIQEIVRIRGKLIQIYGFIYRENLKMSPFIKFIEKLFASREKYEDEGKTLMHGLV